jgi:NTP pyrophosphatase (non-canonical NTP hydrolase)
MQITTIAKRIRGVVTRGRGTLNADIDSDWYVMKLQEELGELTEKYMAMTGRAVEKPSSADTAKKELSNEISDVLCLTLLLADRCKINLKDSIQQKWYAYAQ